MVTSDDDCEYFCSEIYLLVIECGIVQLGVL